MAYSTTARLALPHWGATSDDFDPYVHLNAAFVAIDNLALAFQDWDTVADGIPIPDSHGPQLFIDGTHGRYFLDDGGGVTELVTVSDGGPPQMNLPADTVAFLGDVVADALAPVTGELPGPFSGTTVGFGTNVQDVVQFVAPQSGRVRVDFAATLKAATGATGDVVGGLKVSDLDSATVVLNPSSTKHLSIAAPLAISATGNGVRLSGSLPLTGLQFGDNHQASLDMCIVGGTGTWTLVNIRITVTPLP